MGWLGFWSQFKKIHSDTGIDKCDKIEYLLDENYYEKTLENRDLVATICRLNFVW